MLFYNAKSLDNGRVGPFAYYDSRVYLLLQRSSGRTTGRHRGTQDAQDSADSALYMTGLDSVCAAR